MLFADLAAATEDVRAVPGRKAKVERLASALRELGPDERRAGTGYLAGAPRQRVLGVGWAALREPVPPALSPALTVADVDAALDRLAGLSGSGSVAARRVELGALLARATESEQAFLRAVVLGDLRQGALAGVLTDAVARAAGVPLADVRRALMLRGDLGAVAEVALGGGDLGGFRLEVGRPLQPMLASTAPDVAAALEKTGPAAIEWKLDGARIQVHRAGSEVAVFTRTLDDVTPRLPEVVEAALALPVSSIVLDGEAIALRPDGRPHPFQVTGSRFGTRTPLASVPLTPMFFDVLHLDGEDLLDRPASERRRLGAGARAFAGSARARRRGDAARGAAMGHEGVVVKALDAPYEAGRRGSAWVKVKPVHTLDLVVLAAEWGHGRRHGWLSNLHLGARGPDGWVMLGKTFKGLTDAMLRGRPSGCCRWRSGASATSCTCGRSSSSRSRSTACRRARATRAASRCASRA